MATTHIGSNEQCLEAIKLIIETSNNMTSRTRAAEAGGGLKEAKATLSDFEKSAEKVITIIDAVGEYVDIVRKGGGEFHVPDEVILSLDKSDRVAHILQPILGGMLSLVRAKSMRQEMEKLLGRELN